MTRALVTQLVEALEKLSDTEQTYAAIDKADAAIKAAREYLSTEPSGERAELIERLRSLGGMVSFGGVYKKAADMMEADAQPKQVTCQIYGHVVGACVECNTHIEAQQAKRVPMSADDIYQLARRGAVNDGLTAIVRGVEAHHHIRGDA